MHLMKGDDCSISVTFYDSLKLRRKRQHVLSEKLFDLDRICVEKKWPPEKK